MRNLLVIGEMALASTLLVSAGLLARSFLTLQRADAGFEPSGVLTASISLPSVRYSDPAARAALFPALLDDIRRLPGVTAAGAGTDLPWTGYDENSGFAVVGRSDADGSGRYHAATPGYFEALRVPLRGGRFFDERDRTDTARVLVVNRALVSLVLPSRSGRRPACRRLWREAHDRGDRRRCQRHAERCCRTTRVLDAAVAGAIFNRQSRHQDHHRSAQRRRTDPGVVAGPRSGAGAGAGRDAGRHRSRGQRSTSISARHHRALHCRRAGPRDRRRLRGVDMDGQAAAARARDSRRARGRPEARVVTGRRAGRAARHSWSCRRPADCARRRASPATLLYGVSPRDASLRCRGHARCWR